jgi:hypothetical protein
MHKILLLFLTGNNAVVHVIFITECVFRNLIIMKTASDTVFCLLAPPYFTVRLIRNQQVM